MASKENLTEKINFRVTEQVYKELMTYLKKRQETISTVMRQATYDFLKIKEVFENNGHVKEEEIKINTPPQAIMFCDGDKCEVDPRKKKDDCD